jgi:glycosyltransferase involved in cell wall biosynthesis
VKTKLCVINKISKSYFIFEKKNEMRILFVLDKLPCPPRDGATIPTFNWISRLSSNHRLSLLCIKDEAIEIDYQQVIKNKAYVEKLWFIDCSRSPAGIRAKDEFFGRKPFFLGWSADQKRLSQYLDGHGFDVVWGSPLSVTEIVESIRTLLNQEPIYVCGLSDSNTAVLRSLGKRSLIKGLDLKTRIIYLISWLRSWGLSRIEARMLSIYDLILLQTDVDKKWIDKISSGRLAPKTMAVSNGVNDDLFDLPFSNDGKDLLFLGILSNGYGKSLEWLMNNVWPKLKEACKSLRLHVVGRGASNHLRMRMVEDSHITYREYVPNICDIFKNKCIMLSPVFKGYGLINKVVESMAAAVPVIGTADSFNGIPEFANGRHGIVADSGDSFIKEALNLLNNPTKRKGIADLARELVKKNFLWQDRINAIVDRIELIKSTK